MVSLIKALIFVFSVLKYRLSWLGEFMGGEGDITLDINKEFYDATIDPQMLAQAMVLQDRGVIGKADIRYLLRKGNILDAERTDQEIARPKPSLDEALLLRIPDGARSPRGLGLSSASVGLSEAQAPLAASLSLG